MLATARIHNCGGTDAGGYAGYDVGDYRSSSDLKNEKIRSPLLIFQA